MKALSASWAIGSGGCGHLAASCCLAVCVLLSALGGVTLGQELAPTDRGVYTFGGIELGSQGLKRLTVVIDSRGNIMRSTGRQDEANIGLVKSVEKDKKRFTKETIELVIKTLNNFKKKFADEGISSDHIIVAASSGVGENAEALAHLGSEIEREVHLKMYPAITGDNEALYTYQGIITSPEGRRDGLLVDVGGGNTKIMFRQSGGAIQIGAKTLAALRGKKTRSDADADAEHQIDALIESKGLNLTDVGHVYINGGTAFIIATYTDPEGSRVGAPIQRPFTPAQLDEFLGQADEAKKTNDLFKPRVDEAARRERVDVVESLHRAEKIYRIEDLRAGAWILQKVVAKVQRARQGQVQLVFDSSGEFAWMKAYIAKNAPRPAPTVLEEGLPKILETLEKMNHHLDVIGGRLTESSSAKALGQLNVQLKDIQSAIVEASQERPLREDLQSLKGTIGEKLDAIAAALRNLPTGGSQGNSGSGQPAGDSRDAKAARLFVAGLSAYRRGCVKSALQQFRGSTDANRTDASAWYFRAFTELELGDETGARRSIGEVARLIDLGRANHADLCRAAEWVQGPVRQAAESLLMTMDSTVHGAPQAAR
jgi:hypothetical protein